MGRSRGPCDGVCFGRPPCSRRWECRASTLQVGDGNRFQRWQRIQICELGDRCLHASFDSVVIRPRPLGSSAPSQVKEAAPASYEDNQVARWTELVKFVEESTAALQTSQGSGLAIIYEPTRSPTLAKLLADVKTKYPQATLVEYESVYRRDQAKAIEAAGAGKASILYDLNAASVIVAIDDDLLGAHPNAVLHAKQFAKYRTPADDKSGDKRMNRLYAVESQYSVTGSIGRFPIRDEVIADGRSSQRDRSPRRCGSWSFSRWGEKPFNELTSAEKFERMTQVIATDLLENKGNSLLTVGAHQPIDVQQTALRLTPSFRT